MMQKEKRTEDSTMDMKIIWAAAIFFGGWLFSYLFVRQLAFNFRIAYPMIRKLRTKDKDLIAPGADKYTNISVIVSAFVILLIFFVVTFFCRTRLHLLIGFSFGVVSAFLLFLPRLKITERATFDLFCSAYSRFIPDDELRTAMYERDPKGIRRRLRALDQDDSIIPTFPG